MKIFKSPTKKLAEPSKELLEFMSSLTIERLYMASLELDDNGWNFPKSDLFHWVSYLNQWDVVLESIITKYDLKQIQSLDFTIADQEMVKGILKLEWYLWENCTNRNLYNSYEHLKDLLNSTDLEIIFFTLKLLTRPASRTSSQRNLKNIFSQMTPTLIIIAQGWGQELSDFGIFKLYQQEFKQTLYDRFYMDKVVTISEDLSKYHPEKDCRAIFEDIKNKYLVPKEKEFGIFFKIRVLKDVNDLEKRKIWGSSRLLALINVLSQEVSQSTFFLYEPDLIQKLAQVLNEEGYEKEFMLAVVYTLEAMCHFRSKLSDVLQSLNASVNHGILLNIIRKMVANEVPFDLAEAFNSLVGYIISTQSGGTMLISAGVISVLLETVVDSHSTKSVTKSVNILDNILYGFPSSFNVFMESNGLEIIVKRIEAEVALCVTVVQTNGSLPFDRGTLLRALLKFIMHMMQTSGSADRMRNLIESSLPKSILIILDNSKGFGANVFGISINIMATFIHNEPNSLNILQEAKIPQAFLNAINSSMPVSAEVISAIPNAFGAICLNSAGLKAFNEANRIETYLQIFTEKENLRTVQDNDVPHLVGNSMDELIRHQPSLKESVISALISMLSKVNELGDFYANENLDKTVLLLSPSDATMKETGIIDQQREEDIVIMIDVVSRLLEGLFQNVAHAQDFVRLGGTEKLQKLSQLTCIPYDFTSTPSSFTLSYLFRVLIESDPNRIIEIIVKRTKDMIGLLDDFMQHSENGSMLEKFIHISADLTEDEKNKGQILFRALVDILGLIRLFTDMYCTHSLSHFKSLNAAVLSFSGDHGQGLLALFGKLQNVCITEKLFIKKNVPESWYQNPKKEKPVDPNLRVVGIGQGVSNSELEMDVISPVSAGPDSGDHVIGNSSDSVDQNDPRVKNAQMIWYLVNEISSVIANLFKGLIKLFWGRKVADTSLRKSAHAMTNEMALVISDDLCYYRAINDDSTISSSYLKSVLNFLFTFMMDDRSTPSLQTPFVIHLVKAGFLNQARSIIDKSWKRLENSVQKGKPEEVDDCRSILERCLNIFMIFCNSNMLNESPHTIHLTREKDKSSPEYFDSANHIVKMRLEIFPIIKGLLNSEFVVKAGHKFIQAIIQILLHILKAEGESKVRAATNFTSGTMQRGGLVASLFGQRGINSTSASITADPNKVQQLCEMGFPTAAAERALIHCGNNIARATDYLLTHPEVIAEVSFNVSEQQPSRILGFDITAASNSTTGAASANAAAPMDLTLDNQPEVERSTIMHGVSESASMNSEALPDDKAKEHITFQDELDSLRSAFKENLLDRCFVLLFAVPDAIFEIKDLIFLLGKSVSEIIRMVVGRIDTGITSSCVKDFVGLNVLLRLLALISNDPKYQMDGISSIGSQLSVLLSLIRDKDISPLAVSSLFLILESLLSVSDEPKKELTSEIVEALINEDARQRGKSKTRKDDLPSETFVFSINEKLNLLEDVVRYLKGHTIENDLHHALLRIIVRLTRHGDIARKFLELGGLPLLFDSDKLVKFPAQQQLTLMIIRHLVEEPSILKRIFKNEITTWFSSYKPRAIDLNSYLKNFSHLAIRNADLFIEITCSICCLSKYDISGRSQSLILKPLKEEAQAAPVENSIDDSISGEDKSLIGNCELVIKNITASLLAIRSSAKTQQETESTSDSPNLEHIQRCFYLQCLSELLVSYPECRREVISATSRRASGKTPQKSSAKNHFLNHLLHDLIYKDIKYLDKEFSEIQDMKIRKKSAENFWACSVLGGMCVNTDGSKSSNSFEDPRKSTMDAIGKYLKDTGAHMCHSTEERYGIYIALSELLQRILSNRSPSSAAGFQRLSKSNEDHSIQNSKLMLEDGFVGLITSLIAELDEHHPLFTKLLSKMLKPLEILTKSSISLGQATSDSTGEVPEKRSPSNDVIVDQAVPLESEDNGELSNIYRNSALSMFAPRSDDVEGLSPEEGYDEFSSDESMDDGDDADSEVEDEMEIVVPEPFHGANDYDEESGDSDSSSGGPNESDDGDEWEDIDTGESGSELEVLNEESDSDDIIEVPSPDYEMDDILEDERDDMLGIDENGDPDQENAEADDFDEDSDINEEENVNIPSVLQDDNVLLNRGGMFHSDRQRIMELDVGPDGLEIHWAQGNRPDDGFDDDVFHNRPRALNDEAFTHPLLQQRVEIRNNAPSSGDVNRMGGDRSNGDLLDWQAFDDAVGGNALQILEQIFSRTRGRPSGSLRIVEVPSNMAAAGMARGAFDTPEEAEEALMQDNAEPVTSAIDEKLSLLHSFNVYSTMDRWKQELKLMYAGLGSEKALRLSQKILNILIPLAKEAADLKAKKDEEERLIREEEALKKQEDLKREEEKKKQEIASTAAERKSEETPNSPTNADDTSNIADTNAEQTAAATAETEKVTVSINGREVDITGTGIDITFLEALPDDLRQDVISQHYREQRIALQPAAAASSAISPEFLEALPFEIREEILLQDQNDGGTIERGNETESRISSQLLANLDMQLRQQLFPENEGFLSSMPPVFDTASFRQRLQSTIPIRSLGASGGENDLKRPASLRLEPIQLLEKQALMNLVRLIFVPDNTTNTFLHRILINLSQNNKSRSDIAILLLSILAEGSADLASVDRNFSQMTLKSGKTKPSAKVIKNASTIDSQGTFGFVEAVPNLVAQRCLEALSQLVAFNPLFIDYLLSENDQLSLIKMSRTPSKKSKGKEKEKNVIICQYPVIILLRLLERPYFLENSSLLEQLMTLLSNVFKFFARSKNTKGEEANSDPASLTPTESTSKTVIHEDGAAGGVTKSKKPAAQKYPLLPVHNLKSLVYSLRDGVCSSKTFQSALSVIKNVSKVKEFKDLVAIELSSSSQKLGDLMESELQELAKSMKHTEAGMPVEPKILSVFSSALSQQAKLLRLLKAVDFVFFKGATSETEVSVQSSPNCKKDDASEDTNKRSEAAVLYDQLQFLSLWTQLGEILQTINDRSDFMHIATVLLPLIESFMVVSKPYVVGKKLTIGFPHKSLLSVSRQNSSLELGSYNLFVHFTDQHRKILNTLVRNNPSLMGGSFSLLVDNPKILEFDNKKTYFTQQLHKKKNNDAYGSIQVNVRRQYVFEDSYHQLQGRSGDEMKNSKLNVRFYEEEGVDAGGVTREWYTVLARQMFNPDYALFKPSAADKVTYQPNRSSGINPDHLSYFKFVGRIIGKAIYDGRLLDCYFTRSFYKLMLGIDIDYKDIEAIDPSYHKSLEWILNNEITDVLDLNFVLEVDEFGRQRTVELIHNGKNTPVTDENKHEYVHLIAQQRLVVAIKDQINAFLTGFQEIIPKDLIKIFNEQELELLISGLPDIDIDDWRNNTEYSNYSPSSPQIQWFWRAVRSFSQEERAKLIQFVTGTSKVPLEGFARLQGSSGVQKFQIHKDFGDVNRLPSAHTCFNQLDIPLYESYEQLRSNLLISISECGTGFGFA